VSILATLIIGGLAETHSIMGQHWSGTIDSLQVAVSSVAGNGGHVWRVQVISGGVEQTHSSQGSSD
jgi:hypothetical protein